MDWTWFNITTCVPMQYTLRDIFSDLYVDFTYKPETKPDFTKSPRKYVLNSTYDHEKVGLSLC